MIGFVKKHGFPEHPVTNEGAGLAGSPPQGDGTSAVPPPVSPPHQATLASRQVGPEQELDPTDRNTRGRGKFRVDI